jgi:uracil-DNA glycosylase
VTALERIAADIRGCRLCEAHLEPRPVFRVSSTARLLIAGQAPGTRVHASGTPFTDPSGNRLRDWLGLDPATFYDQTRVAIVPMGFCFPGLDAKGGDKPPRPECARTWHAGLIRELRSVRFRVLIGTYAQKWHLGERAKSTLTDTVAAWADYLPDAIPVPHPSWRNNAWLKKNPWFEHETLPALRAGVVRALAQ